ncbi:MAG: hypothetical protein ACXWDG_11075 [Aeromicrobium sp.]
MTMPKWRVFTWVIVVINVLFLVWIVTGLAAAGNNCAGETGDSLSACQAGTAVGASIGVGIIVFLWAFVDIILGILWLVTRPKDRRACPVCGTDVKTGLTVCSKCGHDFAAAARGPGAVPTPSTPTMPPTPTAPGPSGF